MRASCTDRMARSPLYACSRKTNCDLSGGRRRRVRAAEEEFARFSHNKSRRMHATNRRTDGRTDSRPPVVGNCPPNGVKDEDLAAQRAPRSFDATHPLLGMCLSQQQQQQHRSQIIGGGCAVDKRKSDDHRTTQQSLGRSNSRHENGEGHVTLECQKAVGPTVGVGLFASERSDGAKVERVSINFRQVE